MRLLVDVHDLLMTSPSFDALDRQFDHFVQQWGVREQAPIEQHMGVAIQHSPGMVRLSVSKHIENLLQLLEMEAANAAKIPINAKSDLSARKDHEEKLAESDKVLYYKAVGLVRFIVDTVHYKAA